jgi:lipopolysaccharide/colanic/teichoic acid biosynthesis glycosyltransferase
MDARKIGEFTMNRRDQPNESCSVAVKVDRTEHEQLLGDLAGLYGRKGSRVFRALRLWRAWSFSISWRIAVGSGELLKRGLDIVTAALALAALSPLFLLVAAVIKWQDKGPILFWQIRVGRWGRPFFCPKFRSMCIDAEAKKTALLAQNDHGNGITFKMKKDPRITGVGRILRKLSIDELPQLWCVLIGEMSLVGPRPPVPREVALYSLAERRRLEVKPGLTCIWQVSGRGDLAFDKQVDLDVQYIHERCLRMDLSLIARTVPAVLSGRGAY